MERRKREKPRACWFRSEVLWSGVLVILDCWYPKLEALKVIGSSEQAHVVDALAMTGEEGRGSLRKASGSRQTGFDPGMSEWGNPTLA
jgi:hypothetical protein